MMEEMSEPREIVRKVVIVTGLSGSGKSTVVRALEDSGFFCIDNLPFPLLPKVLELAKSPGQSHVQNFAFVCDTREREFLHRANEIIGQLRAEGAKVEVIFLEASDELLIRRYSETRRPHPMSPDGTVRDGIAKERELLADLRATADKIIDTTEHTVHTLKAVVKELFADEEDTQLRVNVLSFGFKHGLPPECDLVFDVRFLPNPYFVEGLREQTGLDVAVRDFVLAAPETPGILGILRQVGDFMLPLYQREGKSYLTVGIGCTGGHHRSVAISESIASRWRGQGWNIEVQHRDIKK